MAETRFIKTVTFGGYDKTEVDKRLEYFYTKLYELKNELRETKLTLEEYKKGTPAEKASETVLAGERAKLTQVQVQNETMSDKIKNIEEENKQKESEIQALKDKNKALSDELEEKRKRIEALEAGGAAEALSSVFIEAQKSANLLVATSKKEADELDNKSKLAAEDIVTDANNKAKKIIFDAEKEAAVIAADAQNKSEQMSAASNNMKAVLLGEIESYSKQMEKMKELFADFEKDGRKKLDDSLELLGKAKGQLSSGGVPVFREPEIIEPAIPEEPVYEELAGRKEDEAKKQKANMDLEKLAAMASAIGGGAKPEAAESKPDENSAETADKAEASEGADGGDKKEGPRSGGGIDLAALAAQAAALDK